MKQAARGAKANYEQAKATRQYNQFESIMGVGNAAHMQNFDPRAQEAFVVPAGNVSRGQQMYPH